MKRGLALRNCLVCCLVCCLEKIHFTQGSQCCSYSWHDFDFRPRPDWMPARWMTPQGFVSTPCSYQWAHFTSAGSHSPDNQRRLLITTREDYLFWSSHIQLEVRGACADIHHTLFRQSVTCAKSKTGAPSSVTWVWAEHKRSARQQGLTWWKM